MNLPATQRTVADLITEYEDKASAIAESIAALNMAVDAMNMAATVQGVYVERIVDRPYLTERSVNANLLKSAWKAIYNRLNVDQLASAKDKKLFEQTIAAPPPLTILAVMLRYSCEFTKRCVGLRRLAVRVPVPSQKACRSSSISTMPPAPSEVRGVPTPGVPVACFTIRAPEAEAAGFSWPAPSAR